jgi:hypothetical protein
MRRCAECARATDDLKRMVVMSFSELPEGTEAEPEMDSQPMPENERALTNSLVLFLLAVVAGFVFIYSAGDFSNGRRQQC